MRSPRAASLMLASLAPLLAPAPGRKKNHPPEAPTVPAGPGSFGVGDSTRFSSVADDTDSDGVSIRSDR